MDYRSTDDVSNPVLAERIMDLRRDHEELKQCKITEIRQLRNEMKELKELLHSIDNRLSQQKGFIAGMLFVATCVGSGIGFLAHYLVK